MEWPFFDRNKTIQMHEELSQDMLETARAPVYELDEYNRKMEGFIEGMHSTAILENPVGAVLLAIAVPSLTKPMEKKEVAKSSIIAMQYLLRATPPMEGKNIPTDNLTGEKFQVSYEDGVLAIRGKEVDFRTRR